MSKILLIVLVPIFLLITIFGLIDWLSEIPKLAEEDLSIVNFGYLGSFLSGTLGILLTAGSLIFLAKTLGFERRKSYQDNFENKFFSLVNNFLNIKSGINIQDVNEVIGKLKKCDLENAKILVNPNHG